VDRESYRNHEKPGSSSFPCAIVMVLRSFTTTT